MKKQFGKRILTNIAQITKMVDEEGKEVEKDIDSVPKDIDGKEDDGFTRPSEDKLPDYTGGKNEKNDPYYDASNKIDDNYYPGQEDDDDFEKVIVEPDFDLSLRKYITAVDEQVLTNDNSREPVVDTNIMDNKKSTTSEYKHTKKPIMVNKGSLVTYTIRVYNEGEVNGYVSEITDYLPNYLIYLENNETNKKYGWDYNCATREVKTNITAKDNVAGREIYKERENGSLLTAYNGDQKLNYIDVEIVCKVDEKALRKWNINKFSPNNKRNR